MTLTPILLPTSPTADIVGLILDVQQAVNISGITHFWVKPETQTQCSASESALAAAAQSLILFSSSCHNDLPASATDLANTSAPYFLELCEAFTQGRTVSQKIADYIHATTKDQVMYICTLVGPTEMDFSSALSLVRYLINTRRPIQPH